MSATTSSEAATPRTPRTSGAITARFAALRAEGRRALVIYITAGHPDPDRSVALMQQVEAAGADVLEVGVPFSDPLADGPVIQASSQQALDAGVTFDGTLDLIRRAVVRIPVVLFGYLNPLLAAGPGALARARAAGADGLLVTDLPLGADLPLEARLASGPLDFIRLVAPTTPTSRMAAIARHGSGFVYLISRLGVTGAREALPDDLPSTMARVREATDLPVCVGFGIARPDQAAAVAGVADGVVVGSAVVRAAGESIESAAALVRSLRAAIDGSAARPA